MAIATSAPTDEVRTTEADSPADTSKTTPRWLPSSVMVVVVTIGFLLPLLRNRDFYYWDDTVGAAVGVWQRIGSAILEGRFPLMEIDMWRGGNFVAEAATGMWNPLMLGLMVGTHPIDDLGVAIGVAKWAFFIIEALGVYFLARGYRANRWWAAIAGTALPLAGWALFVDGTAWINATVGAALLPWAWWAFRRAYLKRFTAGSISVGILFGFLHVSTGNPYSVVTLALVGLAIAVEAAFQRRWSAIAWIVAMGAVTAFLIVIVFVPFALTSQVGFRADSNTFNNEDLSPNLTSLLGLSMPAYKPWIFMFNRTMSMPAMYLAWFFLPLLPWLRWSTVRKMWPATVGILTFAAFFLLFILGPSQIGMFRWPARLIPFFYLAIMVLFVVIASRGLARDRVWLRASLTGVALLVGAWVAFSDLPALWRWQALCTVVAAALLVVAWFWARNDGRMFTVLASGLILFIGAQIMFTPANGNVANYQFTHSRSQIQENFSDRYEGLTVQVTQYGGPGIKPGPNGIWQDFLPGNMPSVAGVESTTAYSGVGFTKLDAALCIQYNGMTCPEAWESLWEEPDDFDVPLADLLRAETVVVQKGYVDDLETPDGWRLEETTDSAYVYRRDVDLTFPDGRVSYVGDGLLVGQDSRTGQFSEELNFSGSEGDDRRIVFARLAWPGYTATVNGEAVPIATTESGLVEVTVPGGIDDGTVVLSWTAPGLWIGLATAVLGVAGWLVMIVIARRRQRS